MTEEARTIKVNVQSRHYILASRRIYAPCFGLVEVSAFSVSLALVARYDNSNQQFVKVISSSLSISHQFI